MREEVWEGVIYPERAHCWLQGGSCGGERRNKPGGKWRAASLSPQRREIRSQATNLVSKERAGCRGAIPTLKLRGRAPGLLISLGLAHRQ